jgi:hypothetical protein
MHYPNYLCNFLPPLGLPQRSADWTARYRRAYKLPPPLGLSQRGDDWMASLGPRRTATSTVLADQSSLRRDKPGGGGRRRGFGLSLAAQSSLRRGEPGGGEINRRVLRAAAVILLCAFGLIELSGQAFAQGVPEQQIAQIRQFEQQFSGSFRQWYKRELHFMRMVCRPTKEQFEKIAADGEPALKATIRMFVSNMRRPVDNRQSDPRQVIAEAVAKSVQLTLSPEQVARYQKELDQRALARKRVWVLSLVRMIDKVLVLTPEQREKLSKILEKSWKDSWNHTQILMYGDQYFPSMPDAEIVPILTDNQKTVWSALPKGNVNFGLNMGPFFLDIGDEVWEEKRPAEKPARRDGKGASKDKAATKRAEKK